MRYTKPRAWWTPKDYGQRQRHCDGYYRRVLVSVGDFDMSDTITRIGKAERKREKRNT